MTINKRKNLINKNNKKTINNRWMKKMIRSYEELVQELKYEQELNKEDIIYDLSIVFPELSNQLNRTNTSYSGIYEILRKSKYSLEETYSILSNYYNYNVMEDWLLDDLKKWLKKELISHYHVPEPHVYKKINYTYPNESFGIEMDIVGVGQRNQRFNGQSYIIHGIEVKTSNASFYRSARQILGYPLFINQKYFACYFKQDKNYTAQQRAYAYQRDITLLKVTTKGNPTEKSKYYIEKVVRRGGQDMFIAGNNFGDDIWSESDGKKIKGR